MVSSNPYRRIIAASLALAVVGFAHPVSRGWAEEVAGAPEADGDDAEPDAAEVEKLTPEAIHLLIDKLASDDFVTRESAELKLGVMGDEHTEMARQRFLKAKDPEVTFRLRRVLEEIKHGVYFGRAKAFLGIQMQDSVVVGGKTGREMILSVMVLSVIPGSAAEDQGIEIGDHILSVNGTGFEVSPSMEFKDLIGEKKAGDEVEFRLRRGGVVGDKKIKLGEMPADLILSYSLETQEETIFQSAFDVWLQRGGELKRR